MRRLALLMLICLMALVGCGSDGDGQGNPGVDTAASRDSSIQPDAGSRDLAEDLNLADTHLEKDLPGLDLGPVDTLQGDGEVVPSDTLPGDTTLDVGEDTSAPDILPQDYLYPSHELSIRILSPAADGWGQVNSGVTALTGVVMGEPDEIRWETGGGLTGYASGLPFWKTTVVNLNQGDNVVTVTARKGDQVATDTVRITYNPAFLFGSKLEAKPGSLFVGQNSTVLFSISMGLYINYIKSSVTICRSNEAGFCIEDIHAMMDDGNTNVSGDTQADDSMYSWKISLNPTQAGKLCYRVKAMVNAGYLQHMAFSPVTCIEVMDHLTTAQCEAINTIQQGARDVYEAAAPGDLFAARTAVVNHLKGLDEVAEAGTTEDGYGVWVRYNNGILGALSFAPEGIRAGDQDLEQASAPLIGENQVKIDSKNAVVLAPYSTSFGGSDEANYIGGLLKDSACPKFKVGGPFNDSQAKLSRWRDLSSNGLVAITTHGDTYFQTMSGEAKAAYGWHHLGSQEVLWTGEPINCANLYQGSQTCSSSAQCPTGTDCVITQANSEGAVSGICIDRTQADLIQGRVVMGLSNYGVTPSFFGRYKGDGYPNSLIYLGSCRSMWNGTLAMELFAAGARTIVGFTDYVTVAFPFAKGSELFSNLIEGELLTGDAMPADLEVPDESGTKMMLLGASKLNVFDADIINPSWETGELTGWTSDGDGRVISRLGITAPVHGKFMALVSTGMGYTLQTGAIEQTFCIPEGKTEISFFWKFFSEEFKEFCGSSYQDTYEAVLEGENGMVTLVNTWVDALCPAGECGGCGSQWVGLYDSDVSFDKEDVWNTMWQESTANIMGLAGQGPVTLRFFSGDVGDSIYDTVVLMDAVSFK